MRYPAELERLIEVFKQLPGVGSKSAERYAFHVLDWPDAQLHDMGQVLATLHEHLQSCTKCGCLMADGQCGVCNDTRRDVQILCVVASAKDVFAIDNTGEYRGSFHVLGGLLSPMQGSGPEQLRFQELVDRIEEQSVTEVIVALDATLEGDATALFLKQELEPLGVAVSRLAFGLPMGSSLDFVDRDTLSRAFSGRSRL